MFVNDVEDTLTEPAHRDDYPVVDMVDYLRETLQEIDGAVAELQGRRTGVAIRLAAIEASRDPRVQDAAEEYKRRVNEDRPYEQTEDASKLVAEAHRRYVP